MVIRLQEEYERYDRYDRYYDDPIYERRYGRAGLPPPPPPLHDDLYERRLPPHLPPPRSDYLRYGRRSPPPRYVDFITI